jgi:hypothetical protein
MSKADDRAWLRKRHAACQDRIAALKTKAARTDEEKDQLTATIESCQFLEKELEKL